MTTPPLKLEHIRTITVGEDARPPAAPQHRHTAAGLTEAYQQGDRAP